jgi:UDP-N-acetylmuramate dehydrogenase
MKLQQHVNLKPYNTFGITASAEYFAEIFSVDDLLQIINNKTLQHLPKLILGGGSNLLFTKDFNGLIIKNSIKGIEKIKEDEQHVFIKAFAGEVWHDLVQYAIAHNYGGMENLSLIPGQVGAAPMQNIGAYGVELESVFDSLEAIDLQNGTTQIFTKEACGFGYRESIFKKEAKGKYCIVSVTFRLNKKPVFNTSYGAIQDTLQQMGVAELNVKTISDAVIHIRTSKLPDPKVLGNAGSFFKNPEIAKEQFLQLQQQYPAMPHYPAADNKIKVPAGWLIEQCGWKGKRVGNTGSHTQQALVLVNYGNATGEEIKNLSQQIQQSVQEKFGIDLTAEVNFV